MRHEINPTTPDSFDNDLHRNSHDGEHTGHQAEDARSAWDIKELTRRMSDLPDNELKQIPVLNTGVRLENGATYLDLNYLERGPFVGSNGESAEAEQYLVPKSLTDYELWNRLTDQGSPSYRLGRLSTVQDRDASDPNA